MAAEHGLDLSLIKPGGGRVEKVDVLTYLQAQAEAPGSGAPETDMAVGKVMASPKARRLAAERGLDLRAINGSGPGGAVLAEDVLQVEEPVEMARLEVKSSPAPELTAAPEELTRPASVPLSESKPVEPGEALSLSTTWQLMAERTTAAWTSVPHFFLLREVNAARLLEWRERAQQSCPAKLTISDLLVKAAAVALRRHPRINASYRDGTVLLLKEVNIGLATAMEAGLAVPVIREADRIGLSEIAARRAQLVERARANRLKPEDLSGGTFTITNLGMYGVDAFNAVINAPQAAILAVGRIAERVAAVNGQPVVQPGMILSASFDHRVVDGARAAQFLATLAELIEEPLGIMN
jgi:pyruvate dehydrogenase E2 component (dihydrolipoamide acetyltransferase)